MALSGEHFTREELLSGNIEAAQAIEPMLDLIDLENEEAYERTMKLFTRPQRLVFAVEAYTAEVCNGGHEQFFFNSSGVVWKDALEGLAAIGAEEAAAILARVVAKLERQIPDDAEKRRAMMDKLEEGLFEEDDDAFYDMEVDLAELEKAYMRKNAADFLLEAQQPEPTASIDSDQLLSELRSYFKKCSDCSLHPEYQRRLDALMNHPLTQELADFLCDKATSKKHWPELRFAHLRILLLNESSRSFDLKQWYLDGWKRNRRLWLRLLYIRGYAMYATESELEPVMKRFGELLQKNHDYTDYSYMLSSGGLLHLVSQYGYPCCAKALEIAKAEHEKIDPLLRGMWTLNERLETVHLLSDVEAHARFKAIKAKTGGNADMQPKANAATPCEADGIHQDVIQLQPGRKYGITIECKIFQQSFPTVPTLSLPEGTEGYIMLDVERYAGIPGLSARKSTKLSARMNTKAPGYFLMESNAGELYITFQAWVPSADGKGAWQESTAFPALAMKREMLAPNKILYGCNAAIETERFNCFVFTVEWKERQHAEEGGTALNNAKKCDASIPQDELIAYAKEYLKRQGFKKKNKRWTKVQDEFTLVFYIQGSQWGGGVYYIRPGVFINGLDDSKNNYGHFWTQLASEKPEQVLRDFETFASEWSDKKLIKERVAAFIEWDKRNPLEKRRAGEVDYEADPPPADLFGTAGWVLEYVMEHW